MSLLARLYLDAGEDPEMAATLARQSVSLLPGLKSGWVQLARALESMGRSKEAREARLKAGEV
jgi:predicted Zn-dependent protease